MSSHAIIVEIGRPGQICLIDIPFTAEFKSIRQAIETAAIRERMQRFVFEPTAVFTQEIIQKTRSARLIVAVCTPDSRYRECPPNSRAQPERSTSNYYEACAQVAAQLKRAGKTTDDFTLTRGYLESRYFSDGQLDLTKSQPLIRTKARRLWEMTGDNEGIRNCCVAEQYVNRFYRNIEPAITGEDLEAHDRVVEPLAAQTGEHLLCNAFETIVVLNFLRTPEEIFAKQQSAAKLEAEEARLRESMRWASEKARAAQEKKPAAMKARTAVA